jgi:hypothetical protein
MGKDSRIFKFCNDRGTEEITAKKFAKKTGPEKVNLVDLKRYENQSHKCDI